MPFIPLYFIYSSITSFPLLSICSLHSGNWYKYDKLVKEFNEIPMHILDLFPQSLIENGELYKFAKRACTALQNALGSDDSYTLLLKLKLFSVLQKTFESDRSRGITTNDDTAIIKEDFWEFNLLRKQGRLIFQNTKYEYLKANTNSRYTSNE
ncbi:hypothetical protein [Wolbachia endosymbiont of Tetranychus urticae]|uniref:hypothetical protein n=1 Tax=Wolbachia endosymbiont of Tetranychus urticae TaxID=169184 RepID=UPI00397CEBE7